MRLIHSQKLLSKGKRCFTYAVVLGWLMANASMIEGPKRILYPTHNDIVVTEKFSDKCICGHSRADHLVPGAVTLDAVTDCNRCGRWPPDYEDEDRANTPKCMRFA